MGGEHRPDREGLIVEGVTLLRVQVQRPHGVSVGEQAIGQHRGHPGLHGRPPGEPRPAVLGRQVTGPECLVLPHGIQAGSLVGVVLDGIHLDRDVVTGRRRADRSALDEADSGVVAAVDGVDGQGGDLGQSGLDVVPQQGTGDVGAKVSASSTGVCSTLPGYVEARLSSAWNRRVAAP